MLPLAAWRDSMKITRTRLQQIIKEELKRALTEDCDAELNEYDDDWDDDAPMDYGDDLRDARRARDTGAFDDYDEFEEDPEGYLFGEGDLDESDEDRNYTDDELFDMATGGAPLMPMMPGDMPMTGADKARFSGFKAENGDSSGSALPGDWHDTRDAMGSGTGRDPRREPRRGNRPAYNAPGH